MARRYVGVYQAANGSWYFRAWYQAMAGPGEVDWKQTTRRGFSSASAASQARRRFLEDEESKGLTGSASPSTTTVRELVEGYLIEAESLKRLGPKTLFDYRNYLESYIAPHIGHLVAQEVTAEVLADWQLLLSLRGSVKTGGPLAPGTIRLARAPLNGAFKAGLVSGAIRSNPVADVPPPPRRKSRPAHWSPGEARQFLALHEGDRLRPLWSFLMSSGLRIGELVWLQWSRVDLPGKRVHIDTFATTLGYEVVESDGKSEDATRPVEIDDYLIGVLREQQVQQRADRLAACDYEDSDYVFTRPGGGDYHPQFLSKKLAALSVEAGLPRLTAHGLRHTCATLMLSQGVPPKVAAERLGHADPTLFMNLYSHVTPTMQREAAERLGDALFGD